MTSSPEPAAFPGGAGALPPFDAGSRPRSDALRRTLIAVSVAALGVVDLLSAVLSHPPERLLALRHLVPTDVLDTSRTFTLLAGALLVVTAWGLRRGKRRAFAVALFLAALSVPVNLLKAIDFEEATVAAALLFILGMNADAFRVKSREISLQTLRGTLIWATLALLAYAAIGSWTVERLFGPVPSWRAPFLDAAWRMFGIGSPVEMVSTALRPAEARIVTWYLKSLPVLTLVVVLGTAIAALRPASHPRRHRTQLARVQGLLREHGSSTVSAFALAEDSDFFFSANGRAVIAYRFESDTLLAIGDPIGPRDEARPLLTEFARFAAERDWQIAFFQARPEWLDLYRELGWRALHIGEDPVLWTDRFTLQGAAVADARRARRKAEASGLEVLEFVPGKNPFVAAHEAGLAEQMREISADWLRAHPGGEKGFCMGRFDASRLSEEWLVVARAPARDRVEGFVTWVPIWARNGWALDLMRRRADSQAGTMELLVTRSVESGRARGVAMLSLSLSALARVDEPATSPAAPGPEDRARDFLMSHLARFYDFKGLLQWKKKFDPSFEDRYLVYTGPLALPRVVLALVRAQSPGGLLAYLRLPRPREVDAARASTPPAPPTAVT